MSTADNEPLLAPSESDNSEFARRSMSSPSSNNYEQKLSKYLIYCVTVVCLGPITAGMVLGYSSPAIPSMELDPEIQFTEFKKSLFGSIPCLTAVLGGILGSKICAKFGRKLSILLTNFPFVAGWLFITYSLKNVNFMITGRLFSGLALGMVFVTIPNYISEISPSKYRGLLTNFIQISVNVGILLSYYLGRYFDWRILSLVCATPATILTILTLNLPDSPRFLLSAHKRQAAKAALIKLRNGDVAIANSELLSMEENLNASRSISTQNGIFSNPKFRKAFLLASSVLLLQQLSGINIVVFYTESVYKQAGVKDTNMASIYVALANISVTIISGKFVDKSGRKKLLSISAFGMFIFLTAFSIYFYLIKDLQNDAITGALRIVGLICPVAYIMSFAIGFGGIPWMYAGEILPSEIKDDSSAIANGMNWMTSFLITLSFQSFLVPTLGTYGTFMIFSAVSLFASIYCSIVLIETKNKSLEEISLLL